MDLGVSLPSSNMADVALAMLEKEALENKTAKGDTTPSSKLVNAPCSENQKLESFVRTISRQVSFSNIKAISLRMLCYQ